MTRNRDYFRKGRNTTKQPDTTFPWQDGVTYSLLVRYRDK